MSVSSLALDSDTPNQTGVMALVPTVARLTAASGTFTLQETSVVYCDSDCVPEAQYLLSILHRSTGFVLDLKELPRELMDAVARASTNAEGVAGSDTRDSGIVLMIDPSAAELGVEGYRLTVLPDRIEIRSCGRTGIFYGVQTLLQLLPPAVFGGTISAGPWVIPCCEIEDRPRFGYRGLMIDVARYFFPVSFIKKLIDQIALHKLNRLHLHLTDDQGWRLEIAKYPRLTEVGAYRPETLTTHLGPNRGSHLLPGNGIPHGGFYTRQEALEIVEYAAARHITVVPEIELPGHARAAIAAYPDLGCIDEPMPVAHSWGPHEDVFNPSEATFSFLEDVLTEVLEIFPSPYIHIGGDEVIKDQWKASPVAQECMRELKLKDEDQLQAYFIGRMDRFLTERGRHLVGWDEILQGGLAPNATVMSWRGEAGGIAAANAGHDVIMAPDSRTYLDFYQSRDIESEPKAIGGYLPLSLAYSYDPMPAELPHERAAHVLGAQAQIWTEYIPTPEHAEYMTFPRLCALSESMWCEPEVKDFADFSSRLGVHLERLDRMQIHYRPLSKGE